MQLARAGSPASILDSGPRPGIRRPDPYRKIQSPWKEAAQRTKVVCARNRNTQRSTGFARRFGARQSPFRIGAQADARESSATR